MNKEREATRRSVIVPFLLGGLAGAALGILLAPRAGNETRRQIREFSIGTRDRVSTTIGKGLDLYDNAKSAIASAVAAGKQAYLQERETVPIVQ